MLQTLGSHPKITGGLLDGSRMGESEDLYKGWGKLLQARREESLPLLLSPLT